MFLQFRGEVHLLQRRGQQRRRGRRRRPPGLTEPAAEEAEPDDGGRLAQPHAAAEAQPHVGAPGGEGVCQGSILLLLSIYLP